MAVDEDQSKDTSLSDPDKALEELENIEKTTRRIFDDEESSKRSSSDSSLEPANKKARLDERSVDTCDNVELLGNEEKKLKKIVRKMTRKQLEEMMMTKMTELITNKSEVGQLRKEVDSYKSKTEKWQTRAQALSKQLTDLGTVMKKYITDRKTRPRDRVAPVKITRSVGLQVMTAEQKRLQQHRTPGLAGSPRIASKPAQAVLIRNTSTAAAAGSPSPVRITPVKAVPNNNGLVKTATIVSGLVRKPGTVTNSTLSPRQSPAPLNRAVPVPTSQMSPQQIAAVRAAVSGGQVTVTPPVTASVTSQTSLGDPSKKIECVNLSDEEDSPVPVKITPVAKPVQVTQARPRPNALTSVRPTAFVSRTNSLGIITHPASLPPMPQRQPSRPGWKLLPAKPSLKINRKGAGIVLSWNLAHTVTHATIVTYQLYAYQESGAQVPDTSLWKKVGDVKALPLPMACTLTQFMAGNKYHFAVRANDCHNRLGPFSDPQNITLN